jgi:hypothetical protein
MAEEIKPVEKPKFTQKLTPSRLQPSESTLKIFSFVPENGTPYERVLEKDYYTHVANRLEASNIIQAEAEDGSFWALLLVRAVSGLEVLVSPLIEKRFDNVQTDSIDAGDYKAEWAGRHDKWRVMRKSDNHKMTSGLTSKLEALKWIAEHEKALAA